MSSLTQNDSAPAAGSTYDETPYPSAAFPQTHPHKLAAMGQLFGVAVVAPSEARVLELGCADGANLLPMAQHAPHARFVGIDASAKQVAAAQLAIAGAGLTNVEIRHQNILDFPAAEGKFDYIIVHGIYSWVPEPVREKILAICREHLSENGIAFVSYNAFPGWGMRMALRDMMLIHTKSIADPKIKVAQARALTAFLVDSIPTENNPYGMLLKQELERMKHYSDNYLRHDILEEDNQPFYFHEFVRRAGRADLQYLGETGLDQMLASSFPPKVQETLAKVGNNIVAKEQYMDFLRNRNFRQTLLMNREVTLNRQISPAVLKKFYFTSALEWPGTAPLDLAPGVSQAFGVRKSTARLNVKDSFPKAVFEALTGCAFKRISFDEISQVAHARSEPFNQEPDAARRAAGEESMLIRDLMQLYSRGLVDIFAERPAISISVPNKPTVTPLARFQALNARQVTSRVQQSIDFDPAARYIIAACDGQNDRDGIVESLVQATRDGKLRAVEMDKTPIVDQAKLRTVVAERVDAALSRIAAFGFFAE